MTRAVEGHSLDEPDLLRANIDLAMLLRRADEVAGDQTITELLGGCGERGGGPPLGPSRTEFLAAIS